jgi:ferric-dicitrate binding protein FerR (iron transport regulator)
VTEYHHVELAARVLREARTRIAPRRTAPAEESIALLAESIRAAASRRRRRRGALVAAGGAGMCAAAVAVLLVLRGGRPGPAPAIARAGTEAAPAAFFAGAAEGATVTRAGGESAPLRAGARWTDGDRVRSSAIPVRLAGADGTSVTLAPASQVQLVRADTQRWLRLIDGGVWVHVAKLKPDQRFVIATPDAEVEVRGTRFQVDIAPPSSGCGGGTVTRVRVQEGVVEVREGGQIARVPAGARWPAACVEAPAADARAPRVRRQAAGTRAELRARPPAEAAPSSTLATENDLFGSALRAERDGNRREAVELLDVLLTRFPRSPLRASAAEARQRLAAPPPIGP